MSQTVRTRFAPSPTGYMHVGGVRTALFAWLLARKHGGQFILRIEDTDQEREVEGSIQHIIDSLTWLGLEWTEGPDKEGPHGPYRQSERLHIYKEWAQRLINAGQAYADPYSKEELQTFRDKAKQEKRPFLFRDHRPDNPPEWDQKMPLRFKSSPKNRSWQDEIMGELNAGPEASDDFIILKSDGYPTYNFAHIIDDHLMRISHVIRSQEFIASVPRYLDLYDALEIQPPKLATVPFVINAQGNKKLSKRDGAKDILDYARQGFLPEAMISFMATLGWNDGSKQEVFSKDELIKKFDLNRVQKGGAHFDEQRLLWINGHFIRSTNLDELYKKAEAYWPDSAKTYEKEYKKQVLGLVQERLKYLAELPDLTRFFFEDLPVDSELITNHKQLKKLPAAELKNLLEKSLKSLKASDFTLKDLTRRLNSLLEETSQKPAILFSLIRIATTQAPASPGLADTLAVLGKDCSVKRIEQQLQTM